MSIVSCESGRYQLKIKRLRESSIQKLLGNSKSCSLPERLKIYFLTRNIAYKSGFVVLCRGITSVRAYDCSHGCAIEGLGNFGEGHPRQYTADV